MQVFDSDELKGESIIGDGHRGNIASIDLKK
jgi:hypothetical protein